MSFPRSICRNDEGKPALASFARQVRPSSVCRRGSSGGRQRSLTMVNFKLLSSLQQDYLQHVLAFPHMRVVLSLIRQNRFLNTNGRLGCPQF